MLEQKIMTRTDEDVAILGADAPVPLARREEIVRRYWTQGELTPLAVANLLARQGSAIHAA
jgi:hypothetical protein